MHVNVTFRNLDPSDALKSYVQKKLDRLDKLLDTPLEADVLFSVSKIRHICEVRLSGDRLNLNAREETESMYSAIDMVLDKLRKQLTRSRDRERERRTGVKGAAARPEPPFAAENPAPSEAADPDADEVMVENIEYKPMDVDEAILQMKLAGGMFFVFTNARTERVNVLYRRKDGRLGLIQPNP